MTDHSEVKLNFDVAPDREGGTMTVAPAAPTPPATDNQQIEQSLRLFVPPGGFGEIRIIGKKTEGLFFSYDEIPQAAKRVVIRGQEAKGCYVVMNPIGESLAIRPRPMWHNDNLTTDSDISRRRFFFIDFDPKSPNRKSDDSATDAEKEAARVVMEVVFEWLLERGFPEPIFADSGNGFHLLFAVDLPNDEDSSRLIRDFLAALDKRFSVKDEVAVDTGVHNASRITKLYGTVARKGLHRPERPHRLSQILSEPDGGLEPVSRELIVAVANEAPPNSGPTPATHPPPHGQYGNQSPSQTDDIASARAALGALDPSMGYDDWLKVGMALHSVDTSLQTDWDAWSQQSDKYNAGECQRKWASFDGSGGVGIGTLCKLADDAAGKGWRPARPPMVSQHAPAPARQPSMETTDAPPIRLATGTRVKCGDRDNIGEVVSDDGGPTVTVHFVSRDGVHATKNIPRDELRDKNGVPVVPSKFKLEIRTAGELVTQFTELQRPIIDGLLRAGETMNVISAPKFGKSWLVLGMALSVACGLKWLDKFFTTPGKVLLIDNELHPPTLANRLPRVAMSMGLAPEDYSERLSVANLRGCLVDLPALAGQLSTLEPGSYDLIILDAWYRLQPSGSDENSNGDVTALYNLLDSVSHKIGCAFAAVHHSSKGNQSGKGVTDVGSGAGAQARAPDSHLIIRQHENDDAFAVEAAVRSWPPLPPFVMRREFPNWVIDEFLNPADLRKENSRKTNPSGSTTGTDAETIRQSKQQAARIKALEAYESKPDGDTGSSLAAAAGINAKTFGPFQTDFLRSGFVIACRVKKHRSEYDGFKITETGLNELRQLRQLRQDTNSSDLSDVRQVTTPTSSPRKGSCQSELLTSEPPDPPAWDQFPDLDIN